MYIVMRVAEVRKTYFSEGLTHRGSVIFSLAPLTFSYEFDSIKSRVYLSRSCISKQLLLPHRISGILAILSIQIPLKSPAKQSTSLYLPPSLQG